jgi:hypothetical protein
MLLRSSEIEKILDGTAQGRTISKSDEAATRKSYLSGQPSCADFLHMTLDSTPVSKSIMASSRRTIAGADWSLRQNEAKVQCALSIVTSSHRSSVMRL